MGVTVATKLFLFFFCRKIPSASAKALSTDHLNDVFSNIVALIFSGVSKNYWAGLDAIGAIIIAGFILVNWIREVSPCGCPMIKRLQF
jgi:divalent metal cation (Fe/Co/Zn/Cd) transporter